MNLENLAKEYYGLVCKFKDLAGYVDKNFLLTTDSGEKYVLKLSKVSKGLLAAQNELLDYLHKNHPGLNIQQVITHEGANLITIEFDGQNWNSRLLTFLEGTFMAEVKQDLSFMSSLGSYLGKLTNALQGFYHSEFAARELIWDLQRTMLSKESLEYITDPTNQKIAHYFILQFNEVVFPVLPSLRRSIIYGDANDWNVLTDGNAVTGLIDFGDAVYTQTINELAIAIAYGVMGKQDPLNYACELVKGFHSEFKLKEEELEVLYYLVGARLSISVCSSARSKKDNPDDEYLTISEKPAWELLKKWIRINPLRARNSFLSACGFLPKKAQSSEELDQLREKHISKALSISYKESIHMTSGAFQYMFDSSGNSYLDLVNNIMHVGHCHPRVVEAGQRQMARLNTNTRYHYDLLYQYCDRLNQHLPEHLQKIFLVNSGSAANDLAIRIAQAHTGRDKIMVMNHGYHGNTNLGIEISPYKFQGKGGKQKSDRIIIADLPDAYRERERSIRDFIDAAKSQIVDAGESLSAFIAEPIVGCGGQVPLPNPYLKEVCSQVKKFGGVSIVDEVQTGFGRVGSNFWAFEQQEVKPDILVMGKPMGNGHPLAAVATTRELAESFENGMEFFSSFGGNPVSCAIGIAVLDVIEGEKLQENAKKMGDLIIAKASELMKSCPLLGDVRGNGLFLGFELVTDDNLSPATNLASQLINKMKQKGILLSTDGPDNNVIKIKPPLCINESDVEYFMEHFEKEIAELSEQLK